MHEKPYEYYICRQRFPQNRSTTNHRWLLFRIGSILKQLLLILKENKKRTINNKYLNTYKVINQKCLQNDKSKMFTK